MFALVNRLARVLRHRSAPFPRAPSPPSHPPWRLQAFSFVPLIDWAAHLFGAIAGAAIGVVLFGSRLDRHAADDGMSGGSGGAALSAPLAAHRYNLVHRLASGDARCNCARTRGCVARAAAATTYLILTVGGLSGLMLLTQPSRALLDLPC